MPSAYLQWRFHSGERVVARGPLVFILYCKRGAAGVLIAFKHIKHLAKLEQTTFYFFLSLFRENKTWHFM